MEATAMGDLRGGNNYVSADEMSRVVANTLHEYTEDGMMWDQEK